MTYTVGSLCSGYGGLELGLQQAGIDFELGWFSEVDSKAASVIATHHPGVENLGDLTEIEFCPAVDIVTAGFPCQPVSKAGKNLGVDDERWLIEDVVRIAGRANAKWVFLENTAGILSASDGNAMARVVSALAAGGFDAEWLCVSASDIGAPHGRQRWFCLATSTTTNRAPETTSFADSDFSRPQGSEPKERRFVSPRSVDFGPYRSGVRRWENLTGRQAPHPVDYKMRLNPRFVEWMMGLPDGYVTDVIENRRAAIGCLGNGVVPQQAAYAFKLLLQQKEKPFEAI